MKVEHLGTCDTTIGIFRSDCSYVITGLCLLTDNTRKATENLASYSQNNKQLKK